MRLAQISARLDQKHSVFWLFVIAFFVMGAGIGLRDPWPADEPRFVLVAKQMLESHQWLLPMRGGELYPDKPPVFMWLVALGALLTGSLKIAFLLPSLFAGLGTLALTWDLGRRLWGEEVARTAGTLLLMIVQFVLQTKTAQIDALVTFFITLGIYGFMRFLCGQGGWRFYYLGWCAVGAGVITKGVGILAAFVFIPALLIHRGFRSPAPAAFLKAALGPIAALGIIALWLIPLVYVVLTSHDPLMLAYLNNILFHQTVTRYADSWHHFRPAWYFLLEVIPVFWLPISLLLPWFIPRWWQAIKNGDREITLLLGYVLCVLIFFSLSPGKRGVYLTPATPALALICAPYLSAVVSQIWPRRLLSGFLWIVAFSVIAACVYLVWKDVAPATADALGDLAVLDFGVLGFLLTLIQLGLRRALISRTAASLIAIWLWYSTAVYLNLNQTRVPEDMMAKAEQLTPERGELLILDYREQHLLFATKPIHHYDYHMPDDQQVVHAANWIQQRPDRRVLGPINLIEQCFRVNEAEVVGRARRIDWTVVAPSAVSDRCGRVAVDGMPYLYSPKLAYRNH